MDDNSFIDMLRMAMAKQQWADRNDKAYKKRQDRIGRWNKQADVAGAVGNTAAALGGLGKFFTGGGTGAGTQSPATDTQIDPLTGVPETLTPMYWGQVPGQNPIR